jgi:nicotinate-nucleotide--dimethylbenzimidazole phosphoribosyltransferase
MPNGAFDGLLQPYRKILSNKILNQKNLLHAHQQKTDDSKLTACACIFAGDHETAFKHHLSAYPQIVTGQMILNFVHGGAAMSVLCKQQGIPLIVRAMGIAQKTVEQLDLKNLKNEMFLLADETSYSEKNEYAYGAFDISETAALTERAYKSAWQMGVESVNLLNEAHKPDVYIFGEMGIGNTTNSAALALMLLKNNDLNLVGTGTGISEENLKNKKHMIQKAIEKCSEIKHNPKELLRHLGGFEIVALAGAMFRASQFNATVLLDGLISSAAALATIKIKNLNSDNFLAGHLSAEPLHNLILKELALLPLVQLGLRLGEGSGAALSWSLLKQAENLVSNMATFESAGVEEKIH